MQIKTLKNNIDEKNNIQILNFEKKISLGKETYEDLKNSINTITLQTIEFVKIVRELLLLKQSENYLFTIYILFIAEMNQQKKLKKKIEKNESGVFRNYKAFHKFLYSEFHPSSAALEMDFEWLQGEYDLVMAQPINIYERLVFKINGISYLELKNANKKEVNKVAENKYLRNELWELLKQKPNIFQDLEIVDYLPLSIFEELVVEKKINVNYPTAKVHWLGQLYNENYLFYLAHLRENGTKIIGQPHGGVFSQIKHILGNEAAEMILSDKYNSPMWNQETVAFPNLRASRNLFINLKHSFFKIKKNKLLFITSFLNVDTKNNNKIFFNNDIKTIEFYYKQLNGLKEHFSEPIDFKMHPLQTDYLIKLKFLKDIYPDCELISGSSVQELAHQYKGVIHLDTIGTAIMELSGTSIPQYVYLGPEVAINNGYQSFLWKTRLWSSRKDFSEGAYVKLNNLEIKKAYGPSYIYPFIFVKLIKKLKFDYYNAKKNIE